MVGRNPYENFEVEYRQESEIHRRWQHIEDVSLHLMRKYETNPYLVGYIDMMRSAEKVFVKGKIKHWTNEQIREELARNHIEESLSVGKMDKTLAREIYEDFKVSSGGVDRVDEVARMLLAKYTDKEECVSFITYLRDVYVAYVQSTERGESSEKFKDRLIGIRMEIISYSSHVDISELRTIYDEFKNAVSEVAVS